MKYCSNCGTRLPDETKFCFSCGTEVPAPVATEVATPPSVATTNTEKKKKRRKSYDNEELKQGIQLCDDGKYRWIYALNMWTNPTILFLVFKIFFWVFVGIWALMVIIMLCEDGWDGEAFWGLTWPMMILMGVFTIIALIAYAIVAAMYGGKYTVLFEMDEKGINHCQIKEQARKARKMGLITAAAGLATGNLTTAGVGLMSASRTSMYSSFDKVRSVQRRKGRNLIKVNELLFKNQVYVRDEEFDFVYDYIKSHCQKVK